MTEKTHNCCALPIDPERERYCAEPYHWDDGVPYCDTCGIFRGTVRRESDVPQTKYVADDGWTEAAIAWAVCASIHREYAKGRDPFYKTRQKDFAKHQKAAREKYFVAREK